MSDQVSVNPWGGGPSVIPLMSEDGDWFAFPRTLSEKEVVRALLWNYADWLLDDMVRVTEDDRCRVSLEEYRALRNDVKPSALRPYDPTVDVEWGGPGWFFECNEDDERKVADAWTVRL